MAGTVNLNNQFHEVLCTSRSVGIICASSDCRTHAEKTGIYRNCACCSFVLRFFMWYAVIYFLITCVVCNIEITILHSHIHMAVSFVSHYKFSMSIIAITV